MKNPARVCCPFFFGLAAAVGLLAAADEDPVVLGFAGGSDLSDVVEVDLVSLGAAFFAFLGGCGVPPSDEYDSSPDTSSVTVAHSDTNQL